MSSHVVVIDKTARRHTVKVSAETLLNTILVQACKKAGIEDTSNYGLKNNNKTLDLSLPFRFTKLAAGAKLELVQLPRGRSNSSEVIVALQLMDGSGERLTHKFVSSTSIWSILRTFEVNAAARGVREFSITETYSSPTETSGSGRLFYRMPVVQIVNRELSSFEDLQQTLASMGLSSGTVLLRLKLKQTDIPLEQAVEKIASFATAHPPLQIGSSASPPPLPFSSERRMDESQQKVTPIQLSTLSDIMEKSKPEASIAESPPPAQRSQPTPTSPIGDPMSAVPTSVKVFKPTERSTPHAASIELAEDDFQPNIAQLQQFQTHLQEAARPRRLLSDKEQQEKERLAREKKEKIPEVEVRVRFPDQSIIQATFKPSNTAEDVYNFVRSCLRHPTEPFYLFQAPPVRRISPMQGRLVLDCNFTHRTLVNFSWEAENVSNKARAEPLLNDKYQASAQTIEVQKSFAGASEQDQGKGGAGRAGGRSAIPSGPSGGGIGNKIPKWLKFPGKK